jgi:hypothetical protein
MASESARTADPSTTTAGSRSNQPPPSVFLDHYRKISDLTHEHKAAGAALARAKKAAKGDGVDLDSLALLQRLATLDDDDAASRLRKTLQYAIWLEMPIGKQATLFPSAKAAAAATEMPDDNATAEHRAWAAEEAGHEAGRKGLRRVEDNPYAPGTELHVRFDKGWIRGQKVIADKLGANARAADPRRSRTRPAAEPDPAPAAKAANGHANGTNGHAGRASPARGKASPTGGKGARGTHTGRRRGARAGSATLPL